MREVVDLRNNFIEPIDFIDHNLIELLAKIRVIETLRQELRKSLNRDERITNFVGHAGGQVGPERRSIEQRLFLAQSFLNGQILDYRDRAEGRTVVGDLARFDRKRSPGVIVDPLLRRQRRLCSNVSRRKLASLLPTASTGLLKVSAPDRPRIFSAGELNQRTVASTSMATMPGGIDFRSVSASVFWMVASSYRSAFSRMVETCS